MLNFSFLESYMYATCSNGSRNTFVTRAGRAAPNPARAPRVTEEGAFCIGRPHRSRPVKFLLDTHFSPIHFHSTGVRVCVNIYTPNAHGGVRPQSRPVLKRLIM